MSTGTMNVSKMVAKLIEQSLVCKRWKVLVPKPGHTHQNLDLKLLCLGILRVKFTEDARKGLAIQE